MRAVAWAGMRVRLATTAQALPSWGWRVVLSLSKKRDVVGSQRIALAAVFTVAAAAAHVVAEVGSLRTVASSMPRWRVW